MNQEMNQASATKGNAAYPLALPEGTVVGGKYVIQKVLGQGGFGVSYLARDYHTNELVAIKEYFPDTLVTRTDSCTVSSFSGEKEQNFIYGKQCFLQEAKTLAEFIGNPNIVKIYTYFEENNTGYFAMEYVDGKSLKQHIEEKGGKIGWQEATGILFPIMDALSAVHAKGIIHRDISPDNIFITAAGESKLLDFGAARYSLGDKSRSLDVVLKHGYAPKEQYARHGRQGAYTDVYSLAATFYKAITGRVPPDSIDRMEDDDLILPSTLGSDVPAFAEQAIVKALSVQPADRFQNMAAFKTALSEQSVRTVSQPHAFTPAASAGNAAFVTTTGAAGTTGATVMQTSFAPAAPAAPPREDKAQIGLIILSVLVPFAGFACFLTARKTKPKAAKAYLIPALIRLSLFVIIVAYLGVQIGRFAEQKYGSTNGNTYVNEYFNVTYTLPQNFEFMDAQERLEMVDGYYQLDEDPEVLCDNSTDVIEYWDSRADDEKGDIIIITTVYEKGLFTEQINKNDFLDSYLNQSVENYFKSAQSAPYQRKIGDTVFSCVTITYSTNLLGKENMYYSYYLSEKDGNYFLINIVDNDGNKGDSTEEYFKLFKPIK